MFSFHSISVYKSHQGSKKFRLQHFFTPEKSTVMSLAYMSQYLFAGLVNGNITIYTKAEGTVMMWFDDFLRNSYVSIFWQQQISTGTFFPFLENFWIRITVKTELYGFYSFQEMMYIVLSAIKTYNDWPPVPNKILVEKQILGKTQCTVVNILQMLISNLIPNICF